ncbi:MAG: hypothetical protein ACI8X5_002363 [Planctomycetota bacterium]|jgi:hypothetical protein
MSSSTLLASSLALLTFAGSASAGTGITITITGTVEYNAINPGTLGQFAVDDAVTLQFELDSAVFTNGTNFPTRGYHIDQSSFVLSNGTNQIGLENPFPGTPYFVLRDNDPAVDGFLLSSNVENPFGVELDQTGNFGQFNSSFYVTYGGSMLPSLDILDALGTYDFTGLTVFNWTVDDGPFNPMGMIFEDMTIECTLVNPTTYCTGKVNSQGCTPFLTPDAGIASLSGGPFNVTAHNLLNNKPGMLFYGYGDNNVPLQGGTLCVQGPLTRTGVQMSGGSGSGTDCTGQMVLDLTSVVHPSTVPAMVYVQSWSRDPADPFGSSFSNGAAVFVCP